MRWSPPGCDLGVFHLPCSVNRVVYLVDGFNLYHSLADAQRVLHQTTKWLNLPALCRNYLPVVGGVRGERATLKNIYYFSAPPTHHSKNTQARHDLYMMCLAGSGVQVSLGQFKQRKEKETDVAIAAQLFEICYTGNAESVVMVTGDTDQAPAVRTCQRLFPAITLLFAFPYNRVNDELRRLAPGSFKINVNVYLQNQFPDPLVLPNGTSLPKPTCW